jgi:hypothetical protein
MRHVVTIKSGEAQLGVAVGVVPGLVSEKTACSENLSQTFAAIGTIEVTLNSGLPVIRGVKAAFDLGVIV